MAINSSHLVVALRLSTKLIEIMIRTYVSFSEALSQKGREVLNLQKLDGGI